MSKNKIIFAILGAILLVFVTFLALTLRGEATPTQTTAKVGDISIWVYGDDAGKFQNFLTAFKTDIGKYQNKNIVVESFSDYETYQNTLTSAVLQGVGPDLFVLNNNETSILENQIVGIDPSFISPNDFRKAYKGVFGDDLIQTLPEDTAVEFLKGVPIGYQSLGIYFNRRYFKSEDFETWTSLNSALEDITDKSSSIVPIALGNANVIDSEDILMQMFLSLGDDTLVDTSGNTIKQTLQTYLSLGERRGDNGYDSLSSASSTETNLDYFSKGDVVAVAGYPSMLEDIQEKGYQKNFLLATPFPQYATSDEVSLVNYNYFVVNKDTQNQVFLNELLGYMVSEQGVDAYMQEFPYYLPASLGAEEDILEKKIHPDFNIVYKDFINREAILSSYNAMSIPMFENAIERTLHAGDNNDSIFENQKAFVICSTNKSQSLTNISSGCK